MRKFFLSTVLVFASAALLSAQDRQWAKNDVLAEPSRWGGTFAVYPEGQPVPPKAPKGYKPFYISHMGRHGSRFVDGSRFYPSMLAVWKTAAEKGQLTPAGRKFYEAYAEVYPQMLYHEGILTLKGQQQHRQIADQIYRNYPEIFKGKTRAVALSTESSRVLVSMMCCLDELNDLDRDLTYVVDYGRPYYAMLIPESHSNPDFKAMQPFTDEAMGKYERFAKECFDEEGVLGRWFTSTDGIGLDRDSFMYDMMQLVSDSDNLDFPVPEALREVFTPEERYAIWRVQNYSDYMYTGVAPGVDKRRFLEMSVAAKDIIDRFEEDQANGVALRMRFSHDTALAPLVSYLGVNGMDAEIEDPYDVKAQFGRLKRFFDPLDVLSVDKHRDNGSICARASDVLFFHLLDQTGLCISCRWLSELLLFDELLKLKHLPLAQLRNVDLSLRILGLVDLLPSVKDHARSVCFELVLTVLDDHLSSIELCCSHTGSYESLPDKVIELVLIRRERFFDGIRFEAYV